MKKYTFARFWKCALQVNPFGYISRYRGQDHSLSEEEYNQQLLNICKEEDIKVIGLADHGNVSSVKAIRETLSDHGIIVFPGFEIESAEKVHFVCLFSEDTTTEELNRYLGNLELLDPTDGTRPSKLSAEQLLERVTTMGGFVYAAHCTLDKGLLKQKLNHIWKHPLLKAAQIPGSVKDLPPEYKQITENTNLDYKREYPIALINARDVAKPEDLRVPGATTYVKMTRPCFQSFMVAFKDPESRVRRHDQMIEKHYSRIESIRVTGGYLDGLNIRFSDHLNTVIGGRGTGKSTLLECIRYALDIPHKGPEAQKQGDQIIRENLGKDHARVELELCSAANNMKRYKVIRRFPEPPRVIDEKGNESVLHPRDLLPKIEIYGQNEIFELARDHEALIQVLDRFLANTEQYRTKLAELQKKLKKNANKLVNTEEKKEELEQQLARLPKLQEQVDQFRELGLEEKLKQVPLLEKERGLGQRMNEELQQVQTALEQFQYALPDLVFLSDRAIAGLPHEDILERGRKVLENFKQTLDRYLTKLREVVNQAGQDLATVRRDLDETLKKAEKELEKEFARLPEIAGQDGKTAGRTYQSLLREIEKISPAKVRLSNVETLLKELHQERRNLLGELSDLRSARTHRLQKTLKKLNKRLKGKIRIQVIPEGNREKLKRFLLNLPGIGEKKVSWIDEAEDLTISGLVKAIQGGKDTLLSRNWGLTLKMAEMLTHLTYEQMLELESIDIEDRISLELNVSHQGEHYKPLEQLSTGQQCTAILHLLLLDNPDPLIMDQPEDNLDNAFIAERIVKELRRAKTERQFLFATHNANIPVFGDAEWIGVFTATEDHAEMDKEAQGSIDIPEIRDKVAEILEGGKAAFIQRKEKYGY